MKNCQEFFAGGNTCRGFHSLFHYIPGPETSRVIILKGGPGTGKSTLMKQVGQQVREKGLFTELFYCSSDQHSLDGLSVPALGLVMLDGTAPHVIDPKIPGAYDEIINLGDCWDAAALRPFKEEIAALIRKNGEWFTQAYQYLQEAGIVLEKMRYFMRQAMDYPALVQMTHRLLSQLVGSLPPATANRQERHLFGGAITPGGLLNFYQSIFHDIKRYYLLIGDHGSGKSTLLRQVNEAVAGAGHDTVVYHCAFDPERFDAVVIPSLQTAFVKATYPHSFTPPSSQPLQEQHTLALSRFANATVLKSFAAERAESQDRFWYLLEKAVTMIRSAKENHDQLEAFYTRSIDFSKVAAIRQKLISLI
ncbi:MAG: hypothetical protein M1552_03950 [Firmicutes bacterium]|nr:hypothetical protein [Bacillota bacterium]MCL5993310.1 hypothetical protein [Bacillota bacterium]